MPYKVSVVVPALNEEKNIVQAVQNTVDGFQRCQIKGEIIVVNDGSTDGTQKHLDRLSTYYPFLKVIVHDRPMGIGRSFRDGVNQATGDVVTLLPGDGENDAYEILRYLPLMASVDIVIPFVFNRGARSLLRQLFSRCYRLIINPCFGLSVNYLNGTVLYRRSLFEGLPLMSSGFFYQAEILIRCLRAGYLYAEVPYGLKVRGTGESKAVSFKALRQVTLEFVRLFVSIHFSRVPVSLSSDSLSRRRLLEFPPDFSPTSKGHLNNANALANRG